jgi:divalent metal cation (Fe/Co/Zn/Cd) transporter
MTLVGFVIGLLVIGILWWAVQRIVKAYAIEDPIKTVILVVFALLVVLWLLGFVAGVPRFVRIW